jgi:hypothetical protein
LFVSTIDAYATVCFRYGDKTPRSVIGRVFGMVWITMGVIIISFFTATIASTITIATVEKSCHKIENKHVS